MPFLSIETGLSAQESSLLTITPQDLDTAWSNDLSCYWNKAWLLTIARLCVTVSPLVCGAVWHLRCQYTAPPHGGQNPPAYLVHFSNPSYDGLTADIINTLNKNMDKDEKNDIQHLERLKLLANQEKQNIEREYQLYRGSSTWRSMEKGLNTLSKQMLDKN